jgi:hypothetical protein
MKFDRAITTWVLAFGLILGIWPAPASGQTYPNTGPISGYMDFHFNKLEGEDGLLDFHRFVLILSHSFSPRIRFVGEVELEHAFVEGLEERGEVELEQGYVDFLLTRGFNIRAGMVLVPIGIINERHEPPVFQGVERPFVDTFIIPTTWFDTGAGIHGEFGRGFRYRAYAMPALNALEFTADEGIREGRQKGSEANVHGGAFAGRVEYVGTPGLTLGASLWSGQSGFAIRRFDVPVTVSDVDVRYKYRRLETRGVFSYISIGNAAELNDSIQRTTGISPNVASALRGFYGEADYRVWAGGVSKDLVAFVRYENFDTQYKMPAGFQPLKEFDRDALWFGMTYYPDPDVAVKVDYIRLRNQSGIVKTPNRFNVGLGWWF